MSGLGLSKADYAAMVLLALCWGLYTAFAERSTGRRISLNVLMNHYRLRWMLEMQNREARIFDASLLSTLQNGTAFFASTSLLALGGTMTLLRGADDAIKIFSDCPSV